MYSLSSQPSTHSCTASFFSSFSSCLGPLNVDVAVVWTPCDVTSSTALFWSVAEGDGDSAAGLPGLLAFVVAVVDGAGAPTGVPAAITTTPSSAPSRPAMEALSRGRSLGLSAGSLGGLVIIWSKAGSEFELDCNWVRGGTHKLHQNKLNYVRFSPFLYCKNERDTYPKIYTKFL